MGHFSSRVKNRTYCIYNIFDKIFLVTEKDQVKYTNKSTSYNTIERSSTFKAAYREKRYLMNKFNLLLVFQCRQHRASSIRNSLYLSSNNSTFLVLLSFLDNKLCVLSFLCSNLRTHPKQCCMAQAKTTTKWCIKKGHKDQTTIT